MSKGRSIKLYLVDGTPGGLITAEIMNWTGHVLCGPRARLPDLLLRNEAKRSGVYLLLGSDEVVPKAYIGESDDLAERFKNHQQLGKSSKADASEKLDDWDRICLISSKDANLTKGHVKYLESRLIALAKQAGRSKLVNVQKAPYKGLPEADEADMEYFVEQVESLLPVLGIDILRAPKAKPTTQSSPAFVMEVKKHGLFAKGQEVDGEFVVLEGSQARLAWEGVPGSYQGLFEELVQQGVLAKDKQLMVFTKNYPFKSPSAAASIVAGRSASGPMSWYLEGSNQTYGQWQSLTELKALADTSNGDGQAQ
ncbi:GIY-YIG nuclease family protein [Aquabacterium sp. A08]|uniref:GIY-YIG nuclease family protein n=1 Tax=Aquabacterium sp. A08 TaxID=2718532 RepID=UPI0014200F1E|nr:GIY-YIG nuclease family protein [Aquabacterium sp. A08]NIC42305.1 GIY-YIG nuclease family protein [Aquabacterium sp. A08]